MADGLAIPLKKQGLGKMSLVIMGNGVFIRHGRQLVELPGLMVKRIVLGSGARSRAMKGVR